MKSINGSLILLGLIAFAGVSHAAPVLVSCATAGSGGTNQVNNSVFLSWTPSGGTNGCAIGDKQFTNFLLESGSLDPNEYMTIAQAGNIYIMDQHDGNLFVSSFTLSYDITIDPTLPPANNPGTAWAIVQVNAGGTVAGSTGSATLTKTVDGPLSETVTFSGGNSVASGGITTNAQTLHVVDTFTQGSTAAPILDLSNTFTQADTSTPEPGTVFLMGGAFFGLSLILRKRTKKS